MLESTGTESSKENKSKPDEAGVDSEATSKETLSDLERNEDHVGSSSSKPDPLPPLDGALDESKEIKDAGPM